MNGFIMIASRNFLIVFYFLCLLLLAPTGLLVFDSYYYWEWSRHLALSYYDGPPMIAYFIKSSTLLFGDTVFALNLVAIVVVALTSRIIYKTGRLFLSEEASFVAMALWLFSPLVTQDLLKQVTYDTPLMLFWALTLYHAVKYLKFEHKSSLYWVGVSIGLMMLSKYSGVVLVLSLLVFLIMTPYRKVFKKPVIYLAILCSLVIFSPVIIWNYQHDWLSFLYQLKTHALSNSTPPLFSVFLSFFTTFIPSLNIMLIPPLIYWLKKPKEDKNGAVYSIPQFLINAINLLKIAVFASRRRSNPVRSLNKVLFWIASPAARKDEPLSLDGALLKTAESSVYLCEMVCAVFLFFYLVVAAKATIRAYWLTPYLISSALLGGYCFQTFRYRKSAYGAIVLSCIVSFGIMINGSYPLGFPASKNLMYYRLIEHLNDVYPNPPKTILTAGWFEARVLFYLKNKPNVYTLDCGSEQNQYAIWSQDTVARIRRKEIKSAWYIAPQDHKQCLEKYFDTCEKLPMPTYPHDRDAYTLYVYNCSNN